MLIQSPIQASSVQQDPERIWEGRGKNRHKPQPRRKLKSGGRDAE